MNKNRVFLKEDVLGNKFYIEVISKKDVEFIKRYKKDNDLLKEHFGLIYKNILAYGEVETPPLRLLNKIIDYQLIERREGVTSSTGITIKEYRSYKCFHIKDYNMKNTLTIMHEDKHCSWNCLMTELKNPEYILIYKVEKDGK